ncbi:unnamed protein product [Dracunculus medinensis]|uniref:Aldehyde dehydrogenase n=1 Tax=Dracunculus medinensis TaxID=318479 RepID=A0A158Q2I1_DRAME|nr:unnamed protein product [Dracunculus medinensis]
MTSIHQIVEEQRNFFRTGITKKLEHRRQQLIALRTLVEKEERVLTEAVYKDLRRMPKITYGMELLSVFLEIDYMLDNLDKWTSPQVVEKTFLSLLDSLSIVKDPLGVVLIISAWNYPLYVVFLPLIAAIAAGNTAVIKTAERAPNTAKVLADLFSRHFDPHFLTVITGDAVVCANLLAERFDHIFFTGGQEIGKIILAAAAKNLTPVTLELGGKCPVVVESDADIEITARRIAWGKWTNCGQTCISPDYILTSQALKASLVEAIKKALSQFYSPNPKSSPDYNRLVDETHFDILYQWGEFDRDDLFMPPIILDSSKNDAIMEGEIFGPILPIVTVTGLDEAIEFINSKEKPLAAYLFTRNESKVRRFCSETSSGGVCINDVCIHLIVDTLPFGGVGYSGMGRYHGKFGFDTFTHEKSVVKRMFFGETLFG